MSFYSDYIVTNNGNISTCKHTRDLDYHMGISSMAELSNHDSYVFID